MSRQSPFFYGEPLGQFLIFHLLPALGGIWIVCKEIITHHFTLRGDCSTRVRISTLDAIDFRLDLRDRHQVLDLGQPVTMPTPADSIVDRNSLFHVKAVRTVQMSQYKRVDD